MLNVDRINYQKENKKWLSLLIVSVFLVYFTKGLTIVFVVFSALMIVVNKKREISEKGWVDETDDLPDLLMKLPLRYRFFKDVKIVVDKKEHILDYVLVGDNGVFLFKKVWKKGEDLGRLEDKIWLPSDSNGEFNNPIKTVLEEVVVFSTYLKEKQLQSWVQGIVYFANEENVLNVSGKIAPVFANNQEDNEIMLKYILTYQKEILLDAKKEMLIELIKDLEQK